MSRPVVVYVCKGKHCSAAGKDRRAVLAAVADIATVKDEKCRGICNGPVVGVDRPGDRAWFAPLDSKKSRQRLVELLETGRLRKALKKRRHKG